MSEEDFFDAVHIDKNLLWIKWGHIVMVSKMLGTNFDHELDKESEDGHSIEWFDTHLYMLFTELCETRDTLYVFFEVDKEWEKRAAKKMIAYSRVRALLYYALPYRIVLGLSKILVGEKDEFSLKKTVNCISQKNEYKYNEEVKRAINNILHFLENSTMVKNVTEYRDRFFAHLDKRYAMSDIRISPDLALQNIMISEVEKGIELIGELYKTCFGTYPYRNPGEPEIEDIVHLFFGR